MRLKMKDQPHLGQLRAGASDHKSTSNTQASHLINDNNDGQGATRVLPDRQHTPILPTRVYIPRVWGIESMTTELRQFVRISTAGLRIQTSIEQRQAKGLVRGEDRGEAPRSF